MTINTIMHMIAGFILGWTVAGVTIKAYGPNNRKSWVVYFILFVCLLVAEHTWN
jgi:branched-subunit amino acid ABC-type transport system permease component